MSLVTRGLGSLHLVCVTGLGVENVAIHMHSLAKARSLEVKSADLEARRVNLGMK